MNQYTEVGADDYTYDDNGNLTDDDTNTYTWNALNQLTQAVMGAPFNNTATFTYDPFGRRESKTVGATTTNYLNAGIDVIAEYDGSTLERRYVYGPGVDFPIAHIENSGMSHVRTYYHQDRRGSVVATSDDSGDVTQTYTYDPYGRPDSYSGVAIRFTGRWLGEWRTREAKKVRLRTKPGSFGHRPSSDAARLTRRHWRHGLAAARRGP